MDAFAIILTAYGFIINFYPIFSSLDKRTTSNGMNSTSLALAFVFLVYLLFSWLGLRIYGVSINANIFENIKTENTLTSYMIRLIFLGVFLCNLPFVFLPGKEALLVLIEEHRHRSMSKAIEKRIENLGFIVMETSLPLINQEEEFKSA